MTWKKDWNKFLTEGEVIQGPWAQEPEEMEVDQDPWIYPGVDTFIARMEQSMMKALKMAYGSTRDIPEDRMFQLDRAIEQVELLFLKADSQEGYD